MQRNWIGRSTGARVRFATRGGPIEVFTTRPDTLFGATFMVLAPEHALVDALTADAWPDGTDGRWTSGDHASRCGRRVPRRYRARHRAGPHRRVARRPACSSGRTRPTRSTARDPDLHRRLRAGRLRHRGDHGRARRGRPRDWDFAEKFGLPIIRTVQPPAELDDEPLHRRRRRRSTATSSTACTWPRPRPR